MKSFKKLISLVAVISVLATSVFALSAGTASAATYPDIRLHSTELTYQGSRGNSIRTVYIKVNNMDQYSNAYVHYEVAPGQAWQDALATRTDMKSKEGYTIYKASFSSYTGKFCLKYVNPGFTLWDNNYGQDFTTALGYNENVKAERAFYPSNGTYNVAATIRNIAYNKEVKAVYTENNWSTKKTVSLKFDKMYDAKSYNDQTERWIGTISGIKNTSKFKYYLTYKVNGKTYTDNNFGQYYTYNYTTSRG